MVYGIKGGGGEGGRIFPNSFAIATVWAMQVGGVIKG